MTGVDQEGKFTGFPPGALRFLRELSNNNNREWFAAHRDEYLETIVGPSRAFVVAMGERLERDFPDINYDTRMNGAGSLMRMARDTRFRKDKTPYRTSLACFFWEGAGHKRQCPGFFMWFGPDGGGVYAGKWMFPDDMLLHYREAVDKNDSGKALVSLIRRLEKNHGLEVGGAQYKRVPRPYPADHPRADLLRYKGLRVAVGEFDRKVLTTTAVVRESAKLARKAAPLHHWLVGLQSAS